MKRVKNFLLVPAVLLFSILGLVLLSGCGPKSSIGFSLPDGDTQQGEIVYKALQCNECHKIEGVDQLLVEGGPEISVNLGGKVSRIKTYGELVTSVINPSHKIARGYPFADIQDQGVSKMRVYNEVMTVSQLIDLVAFLQSKYELKEYPHSPYPEYYP